MRVKIGLKKPPTWSAVGEWLYAIPTIVPYNEANDYVAVETDDGIVSIIPKNNIAFLDVLTEQTHVGED